MTERSKCQTRPRLSPGAAATTAAISAPALAWPDLTWTVRPGGALRARPALEVYVCGALVDVLVATPLTRAVLGGGCRCARRGRQLAVAWGQLTSGNPPPLLFRSHGPFRRTDPGVAVMAGRGFWVATADGAFTSVTAGHGDGGQSRRLRRIRP